MSELRDNLIHLVSNIGNIPESGIFDLMRKILAPYNGAGWELGPGFLQPKRRTLAISWNGNTEVRELLKQDLPDDIVGNGWEITLGVPPRSWDRYFDITDAGGTTYGVEGREWGWRAAQNFRTIDLLSKEGLPPEVFREAGQILLLGELGEANVDRFVDQVTVTTRPGDDFQAIPLLRPAFVKAFPDCKYAARLIL